MEGREPRPLRIDARGRFISASIHPVATFELEARAQAVDPLFKLLDFAAVEPIAAQTAESPLQLCGIPAQLGRVTQGDGPARDRTVDFPAQSADVALNFPLNPGLQSPWLGMCGYQDQRAE
ncbi:hypothetical protein V474_02720 [Novosphingobium barchaimii LL02]|uniref:Uncharacterized protein n=1 Tax=Novosphingobium barchaimii LL02 TaxID=1114963 RepID=A0A0J7XJZ8_9SPHN|nr:hypothetical protein V474_02720 [Novosphingobium barchaimii LL02]